MAIKTVSHSTGSGIWSDGWHTLTINKAEYGDWNGTRFLDLFFEDILKHSILEYLKVLTKKQEKSLLFLNSLKWQIQGSLIL